jgi:hypothetical protein
MMSTAEPFVEHAVAVTAVLRARIAARLTREPDRKDGCVRRTAIAAATGREVSDDDLADLEAQSIVCAAAVIRLAGGVLCEAAVRRWLETHADPLWRPLLRAAFALCDGAPMASAEWLSGVDFHGVLHDAGANGQPARAERESAIDAALYFYEQFLHRHDTRRRVKHGVFYTPRPLAAFMVDQAHRALIDEFGLSDGLADRTTWQQLADAHGVQRPGGCSPASPLVTVLDPALGSGVFLVEVILRVHRHLTERWSHAGDDSVTCAARWDDYVVRDLLPRLAGCELLLPACVLAELLVVLALAETGFRFPAEPDGGSVALGIHLIDTLAGPQSALPPFAAAGESPGDSRRAALAAAYEAPFTVVIGNPPFSGISQQHGRWITDLLRGRAQGRSDWADYYRVAGLPLAERKLWLQDDYVKFLRYAHWKIESAGCGLVALVTNHGYLDNPTFRGVRYQLLQTFPRIAVLDLHGNLKKRERAPDGQADQSVFAIGSGIAIGVFCRSWRSRSDAVLQHGELWGTTEQKLASLAAATTGPSPTEPPVPLPGRQLVPQGPFHFFVPRETAAQAEYERGYRLPDIMPLNVTAPVTARDSFVVAFDEAELLDRMRAFRDLTIADDELRRRYFCRSRSPRYAAGDTRGWQLATARRRMADDPDWERHGRPCWYRPFDRRVVYWTDWMIDWPRGEVMRHLLAGPNLALIARRQMLPGQPCNYFWVSDGLTLDGIIRSDNRGSESVFPLFVYEDGSRRVNFRDEFLAALRAAVGADDPTSALGSQRSGGGACAVPAGASAAGPAPTAADILYYIYALFFSSSYRERYADLLRSDFPRVLLPAGVELFRRLRDLGARLVAAHLLRPAAETATCTTQGATSIADDPDGSEHAVVVGRGFPKYVAGRILVEDRVGWAAPREVWEYHVGGHQVCRKWLKDRRGRTLQDEDLTLFRRILACVGDTLRYAREIEQVIACCGGLARAFR